eukprot:6836965-Pyramimonas_sp.AAC.1
MRDARSVSGLRCTGPSKGSIAYTFTNMSLKHDPAGKSAVGTQRCRAAVRAEVQNPRASRNVESDFNDDR